MNDARMLAEDLAYLGENAFEFTLEINPEAGSHPGAEELERADENEAWLSPEERERAWATGRWVRAWLYPCGGVTSWRLAAAGVEAVVSEAARICRLEIDRWNASMPHSPRPVPPGRVAPSAKG